MILQALSVVVALYLVSLFATIIGGESSGRPLIICTVIGFVLGDLQTGIIMGGSLEAIFMGINAIGGVTAANASSGAVVCTCLVIMGGMDMGAALALAMPVASVLNISKNVTSAMKTFMQPVLYNIAEKGDMRKYKAALLATELTVGRLLDYILQFFMIAFGIEGVSALMNALPASVIGGLTTAGNMMTVVGLAILAVNIWNAESAVFIFVGSIFAEILGLSTLVTAILVACIAAIIFFREKEINDLKQQSKMPVESAVSEGDDFFG